MESLLVITGPPGAGKSTVARLYADRAQRSALVAGDTFFGFLATGAIEPWLPEADAQNTTVTQAAASAAGSYVRGGYMTVYDGVVGPWFLPTFASAAGLDRVDYVVLLPTADCCAERVDTRQDHGFTSKLATRHMHAQFLNAPIEARHVIRDPPSLAQDVVLAIHEARTNGSLTYTSS
jgi:predicted ABC-type ATPase